MDLHGLRYFALVAEEGSVHGGARRAMVAQPAVSVSIKKLEREVGAPLFVRSRRGVTLTEAGRALLVHARALLRHADDVEGRLRSLTEPASAFTVGLLAGRAAAGELTGPIVDGFRAATPHLDLRVRELHFGDQVDALLDGRVDVAIVRSPVVHDDLVFDPLFSEPSVLVAGPEHRLARREEVTVDEVLGERPLEVVRAPRAWRDFWDLAEYRAGATRAIASHAVTLVDYSIDVLKHATISPMAQSGWRLGGLGEPTIRAVRLVDAPRSVIGVGRRVGDAREEVLAFADRAREVTGRLLALVAGARPAGDNEALLPGSPGRPADSPP
jgi:DNA-binding transcriptional LysR family regulator